METYPEKASQIIAANAELIRQTVNAVHNRDFLPRLEPVLLASERNGWTSLVAAIRKILAGHRDEQVLAGLDDEDHVIIEAILGALRDPTALNRIERRIDPSLAAPGLAAMIDAAGKGNSDALQLLANMAEQMTRLEGDMARLGAIVRRLIDGQRDPEQLSRGMGMHGEKLVLSILSELGKLNAH